jgi:regulator of protease activity HflC (stomatin/prohibitin superfamily)
MFAATVAVIIAILVVAILYLAVRILREYERGVVFTLGRYTGTKGPGFFLLVPFVQQMVRVDLRVVVDEVPTQDVISRDNVSVKVNAVIYFRVVDPERAIIQVNNYLAATSQLAQTTLAGCWANTTSTRCWLRGISSMPIFRTCSISRPRPGASRSLMSRSSESISTRA